MQLNIVKCFLDFSQSIQWYFNTMLFSILVSRAIYDINKIASSIIRPNYDIVSLLFKEHILALILKIAINMMLICYALLLECWISFVFNSCLGAHFHTPIRPIRCSTRKRKGQSNLVSTLHLQICLSFHVKRNGNFQITVC